MATEVIMPQMGFDMKEGTLVRWVKHEGDQVKRGEILAEIETDKAVVEVEAFAAGVLRKVVVGEGLTVPVGQVIALIGAPDESLPQVPPPTIVPKSGGAVSAPVTSPRPAGAAPAVSAPTPATPSVAPRPSPAPAEGERVRASPLARKEAEERGVDIAKVPGTGPGGRVTREDVLKYAETTPKAAAAPPAAPRPAGTAPAPAAPSPVPGQVMPLTRMRQAIARHMAQSKREIPHFYVTVEIDMGEALRLRGQLNEALGERAHISINDMVVKAVAQALAKHRIFNATFTEGGVQVHPRINIGIAVALEEGLIAPAVVDCDRKGLAEIAEASKRVIEHARAGHLSAEEYTAATFTVTNLGMYNVESFGAIITPPQAAALAVASVRKAPVARDAQVSLADLMKVTLSMDHRVADGAQAAQFLADLRTYLEKPGHLLV